MDRKSKQLGLNYGTATHQLKRELFYQAIKRLGEHICYRCGQPIDQAEDLSVDHKIAWLGKDNSFFWDLANISYSHKSCNYRTHGSWDGVKEQLDKVRIDHRSEPPQDKAWCSGCKVYLPVDRFTKNKAKINGLSSDCKMCKKSRRKKLA